MWTTRQYFPQKVDNRTESITMDISIKNTTKQQRIELIRSWTPDDEAMDENSIDLWEMYRDYIDGKKEIAECNADFSKAAQYAMEEDTALGSAFAAVMKRQMSYYRIPGATAVIVHGDQAKYVCLGVKDAEKPDTPENRVDENTLFTLASVSKSFNSAMLACLVDRGILDWDTPVIKYVPELRMMDAEAAENMTLRDMLCHRTGLANHDALWPAEFSHAEAAKMLRYMEPNQKFRAVSQYNNTIYMFSGYVAEAVTGKTWHELVKEYLLEPLGMTHTCSELSKMAASGNFAEPHRYGNRKLQKTARWAMDEAAAAAGVNSCASDMEKWLRFHMTGGLNDRGERILSEKSFAEVHKGQMPFLRADLGANEIALTEYAFGWREGNYRGHRMHMHTGHIEGYFSVEMVMPDDDIAVYSSTNLHNGCNEAHVRAAYAEIDRILGFEKNWETNIVPGEKCPDYLYMNDIADLLPLASYPCEKEFSPEELEGTYVSEAYGPIRIFIRDGRLFCGYHQREDELHHLKGTTYFADTFLADTWTIKMPFEFLPAENGIGVKSMVLPMEKTVRPVEFIKQV